MRKPISVHKLTKPTANGIVVLLALLLSLVASSAQAEDTKLLHQMHEVEKQFEKEQDDSAAPNFDGYQKVMDLEKRAFVLHAPGEQQATALFKSNELKNGFELNSFFADDTIHIREGFDNTPAIQCKPKQVLSYTMAWDRISLERFNVYIGEPGRMHQDGYKSVRKLVPHDGKIELPANLPQDDFVLFALIKPTKDQYFKFVFLMQNDSATKQPRTPLNGSAMNNQSQARGKAR